MPAAFRTLLAQADLDHIWDYIAEDSPAAADRFLTRLEKRCMALAEMPATGTPRPDIGAAVRCAPVNPYSVYYRPVDGGIEVLRVLHQARHLQRMTFPLQ